MLKRRQRLTTEAVRAGANGVLLDEFTPEQLMALVPPGIQHLRVVLEASGIQPEQLQAYAVTGIDLISTSAPVTRSRWLDLSMRFLFERLSPRCRGAPKAGWCPLKQQQHSVLRTDRP